MTAGRSRATAVITGAAGGIGSAIRTGRLWVFTHPERLPAITERVRDMVEGRNPGAYYP